MELKDFTELLKRDFPTVYNLIQRKGKSGLYLKPFINELQNYTDLVCEKQRENCKAAYWNIANAGCDINTVFPYILNAEHQKQIRLF